MPTVLNKAKGQTADSLFPQSRGIPQWRNVGRLAPACLQGSGSCDGCSSGHKIIIIWHVKQQPLSLLMVILPPSIAKRVCTLPLSLKGGFPYHNLNQGAKSTQSVSYSKNTNCNGYLVNGSASEGIYQTILVNFLILGLPVQTVFGLLQSKLFYSWYLRMKQLQWHTYYTWSV